MPTTRNRRYYTLKCPRSWANEPKKIQKILNKWKCKGCKMRVEKQYKGRYYYIIASLLDSSHYYRCNKKQLARKAFETWGIFWGWDYKKPKAIWTKKDIEEHAQEKAAKLLRKETIKNLSVRGRTFTQTDKHSFRKSIDVYLFTSEDNRRCHGVHYVKDLDLGKEVMYPVNPLKSEVLKNIESGAWKENDLTFLVKYGAPGDIIAQSAKPWLEALKILGRVKE